eukprot:72185-Pelagomonas_calceolata.AAC.1
MREEQAEVYVQCIGLRWACKLLHGLLLEECVAAVCPVALDKSKSTMQILQLMLDEAMVVIVDA